MMMDDGHGCFFLSLVLFYVHHRNEHGGWLYRLQVPVCVALAVDVGQRRDDLSEEHPRLHLRQAVLGDDIIKQLSTWTVLKRRYRR